MDVGLGFRLDADQLEGAETETVGTCPGCKSTKLIDMAEDDEPVDVTAPHFFRCLSCGHVVREEPRALLKTTQLRLVKVGAVEGVIVLIEEFAPDAPSLLIYAIVIVVSLLLA